MKDHNIKNVLESYAKEKEYLYSLLGLENNNKTPLPASDIEVRRLEKEIDSILPSSYKDFLLCQNGYPDFDGETNILGINDLLKIKGQVGDEIIKKIKTNNNEDIQDYIVFGVANDMSSAFVFNKKNISEEGEWEVLEYIDREGIDIRHRSFLMFLISSVKEVKDACKEIKQGEDLFDLDF